MHAVKNEGNTVMSELGDKDKVWVNITKIWMAVGTAEASILQTVHLLKNLDEDTDKRLKKLEKHVVSNSAYFIIGVFVGLVMMAAGLVIWHMVSVLKKEKEPITVTKPIFLKESPPLVKDNEILTHEKIVDWLKKEGYQPRQRPQTERYYWTSNWTPDEGHVSGHILPEIIFERLTGGDRTFLNHTSNREYDSEGMCYYILADVMMEYIIKGPDAKWHQMLIKDGKRTAVKVNIFKQ